MSLSLDNTLGAAFIGVVVASALLGVSGTQAWYYFTHQKDRWPLKMLVAVVILCDIIHQALTTHAIYTYLVICFGAYTQLETIVWSLVLAVLFNGLQVFLVQCFFTMRVWRLSKRNIWLTLVVVSLVTAEFVCIVAYSGLAFNLNTFFQLTRFKWLSTTVNVLAAAVDVLTASTLCTLLHRSRTGSRRLNTVINKLILFVFNTGLLTTLCAIASLISIVVAGETFIYIAFFFCIGRLYSNSLLATLNAREMIRKSGSLLSTEESHSVDPPTLATFGPRVCSVPVLGRPSPLVSLNIPSVRGKDLRI